MQRWKEWIEEDPRRQRTTLLGGAMLAFLLGVVLAMLTGCAPALLLQ